MSHDDEPLIWRALFSLPIVLSCFLPAAFAVGLSMHAVIVAVASGLGTLGCVAMWSEGAF